MDEREFASRLGVNTLEQPGLMERAGTAVAATGRRANVAAEHLMREAYDRIRSEEPPTS